MDHYIRGICYEKSRYANMLPIELEWRRKRYATPLKNEIFSTQGLVCAACTNWGSFFGTVGG